MQGYTSITISEIYWVMGGDWNPCAI